MTLRLLCLFCCLTVLYFTSCKRSDTLFRQISSAQSGIHFNNTILQNDSINILDFENVYNGGGVGVGDFNNDGLQDLYFTGNLVPNQLYINKGGLSFEDITAQAGVEGGGRWCRGASVVDINNDGWLDIYVSASIKKDPADRQNLLYINQGADKNGVPRFKEMAAAYGLNDTTQSTMASFFDFDNDGDLDVYIAVNHIIRRDYPNQYRPRQLHGEHPSTDRLYRNDWDPALGHPVFTDVSKSAGILIEGYSHNVSVSDFNKDGWKDIYVTNDYLSQNILYINNRDGTFTDKVTTYFKHTAANAMGSDVADINNDGLLDVVELDMNPEDNYRKKMMLNANSYQTYQNSDYFNYQYQYVRNVVQLNQGPRVNEKDSIGDPVFSDISFFSNLAETDWSWAPLVVDFDNDGFRDIVVTNGFPRDVTDHDFVAFRNMAYLVASKKQMLEQIPEVKIHNYAFRNNGRLQFEDVSQAWGFERVSFSNGAAYADLDNDGDLDVVINNINDEAFLYENTQNNGKRKTHYLTVNLMGDSLNRHAIGAWVEIYYKGRQQVYEQMPYRGYLSTVQLAPHFGLDTVSRLDSLVVKWPNGRKTTLHNVAAGQTLNIDIKDAQQQYTWEQPVLAPNTLVEDVTGSLRLNLQHEERDFIDFNIQKLLPHKFSEYGPALAAGDVNGDGLDDLVMGGAMFNSAVLCLQQQDGSFLQKKLVPDASDKTKRWEDMGILMFDADGDNDLDIYISSGSYESGPNTPAYQDKLYINDGKGNFSMDTAALPQNFTSKSCVRAADYDKDGDLDLFVGGRVEPWNYPKPVSSFVYRNDSKNGQVRFTDVSATVAPALNKIGLVCDAVWTDFDNDGWQDLILMGEWMPLTFLKNTKGTFEDVTASSGLGQKIGWWTSIVPGDFDNDGDIDYIAGNMGLNTFYRASEKYPVKIYAKDFDHNGSYDAVPTLYLPASQQDTQRREFPAQTRDDMTKQLISFKSKYQKYKFYAEAPFSKMFTPEELKDALVLQANYFSNSYIKNLGNGKFEIAPLPQAAQYACLNGMLAEDLDGDGNLDLLATGNDYGTEVSVGRYDACNGLLLKGDGKGGFAPLSIVQSGWFVPGNGKSLVKLKNAAGNTLVAASQNRGPVKMYLAKKNLKQVALLPDDETVLLNLGNQKVQRQEVGYGTSFLSQSSRFINLPIPTQAVTIINSKGVKRTMNISN